MRTLNWHGCSVGNDVGVMVLESMANVVAVVKNEFTIQNVLMMSE